MDDSTERVMWPNSLVRHDLHKSKNGCSLLNTYAIHFCNMVD